MTGIKTTDDRSEDAQSDLEPADIAMDDRLETRMSRRQMMMTTGAAAGAIAVGAGAAAAQSSRTVDWSYDYAHDPAIAGSTTVAEHQSDMVEMEYINDNGEQAHLNDEGVVLAEREDEDTPHNPVQLEADQIQSEEYTAFPRGEMYDSDGDGDEEEDVRAIDATHWTTDASGSTGSIDVADADDDALSVSVSGQADGDIATARFSDFSIDSGMSRKFLQSVFDVTSLQSGATVEVRLEDSNATTVVATVDPSGDTSNVGTIATATGTGKVAQERVGELESDQGVTLEDIVAVEIAFLDSDAGLTIHGINLEKESQWSFGTREFINSDDELDDETVREPSGAFSITTLESLGDDFSDALIYSVGYEVEQRVSELPASATMIRDETTDRHHREYLLEVVHEFEFPTGYDLSSNLEAFEDVVQLGTSRYVSVEVATGEDIEDWDDVENVTWTDRTSRYDSVDKDVTLLSTVSPGEKAYVKYELNLSEETLNAYTTSTSGSGGAAATAGDGGSWFGLSTIIGGALTGLAGYLYWARRKASNAVGR